MTATAVQNADDLVLSVEAAAQALGDAYEREYELQDLKGIRKAEAIARILGSENPLTKKPHSASSAADVVERDEEFAAFLKECREAITARYRAEGVFAAAKLRARLEVQREDHRAHGLR